MVHNKKVCMLLAQTNEQTAGLLHENVPSVLTDMCTCSEMFNSNAIGSLILRHYQ